MTVVAAIDRLPGVPQPGDGSVVPTVAAGPVTTSLARRLRALHRVEPTAVAAAAFHTRVARLVNVADAVLDGLDKSPWVGGGHGSATSVVAQAGAWLLASGVTDVVVCDAEILPTAIASQACDWLAGLGVRPWFVYGTEHPVGPAAAAVLSGQLLAGSSLAPAALTIAVDDLTRCWPGLDRRLPPARRDPFRVSADTFPRVPRVDGLRFRSTAKALLSEDDFAVVEGRFLEAVRATRDWCRKHPGGAAEKLLLQYRAMANGCAGTDELVTVTRGFQVGAFNCDWGVGVSTARLLAAAEVEPRPARSVAENWWARFDLYRTTDSGALAVLYDAGLSLADIEALTLADLNWDPASGSVSVRTPASLELTGPTARLVAAHISYRRLLGAVADDALFTNYRGARLRPRSLGDALRGPVAEIGVTVAPTPVRRRSYTATQWAQRYGVTAFRLHKGNR